MTDEKEKPKRVTQNCEECGSTDVRRDAWASWDEEIQDWVLCEVYDSSFCIDCEIEMALVEEDMPEGEES